MGKLYEAESILLDHTDKKVAIPDSHREVKVILSLIYTLIGEIDRAIYLADQGIQIGQDMKSRFVEAVGYIRKGHAEIFAYPYEIERAEKSYMKAIELMDQLNVSRGKAEALMGLMIVKARKGLYEEAIRYGNYALRDTNKVNDNWM